MVARTPYPRKVLSSPAVNGQDFPRGVRVFGEGITRRLKALFGAEAKSD